MFNINENNKKQIIYMKSQYFHLHPPILIPIVMFGAGILKW